MNDSLTPGSNGKDLGGRSETSESLISTSSSSQPILSPNILNESQVNGRTSPEVHVLDITDLNDPGVRIISKFSFKDIDNKFNITIYGKNSYPYLRNILLSLFRCR